MPSLPTFSPPQPVYDRLMAAFDNDPEKYKSWLVELLREYVREQELVQAEREAEEAVEAAAKAAQEAAALAEQDRQAAVEAVYENLRAQREKAENLEV